MALDKIPAGFQTQPVVEAFKQLQKQLDECTEELQRLRSLKPVAWRYQIKEGGWTHTEFTAKEMVAQKLNEEGTIVPLYEL